MQQNNSLWNIGTVLHLFSPLPCACLSLPQIRTREGNGNHSIVLAWSIPWTLKPGRLQSMGWQRIGHDWATQQQIRIRPFTQQLPQKQSPASRDVLCLENSDTQSLNISLHSSQSDLMLTAAQAGTRLSLLFRWGTRTQFNHFAQVHAQKRARTPTLFPF